MQSTKAAARYAKALLDLSLEQGCFEKVSSDMAYLHRVCQEEKDFVILLNSPVVKSDKKISIFQTLFADFDELSSLFMELITKNRREYMLDDIALSYQALLKAHHGIIPVSIFSARPLDANTRTTLIKKIGAAVQGKPEISEILDESLIGGFIVRMDDMQIDASVSSQFKNLKQRLTR
jgi:F-type H+-transporting ATPase subunit delta